MYKEKACKILQTYKNTSYFLKIISDINEIDENSFTDSKSLIKFINYAEKLMI